MHIEQFKQTIVQASVDRDTHSFRKKVLDKLRSVFSFDAACFTTIDPHTLLSTGALTDERVETIHSRLFESEYLTDDFNQYADLAKASEPVAALSLTTNGTLKRSARYRDILFPAGFSDELRAVLVSQGKCWGFLTLFRSTGQPLFEEKEIKFVSSIIPFLAQSLREATFYLPAQPQSQFLEPGIMIISANFELLSTNPAANQWLSLLCKSEQIECSILPRPIRAVCTRAKANIVKREMRPIRERATTLAKTCILTSNGSFLSIRASEMNSFSSPIQFAVVCERANPSDIMPLIFESYGLSSREKQIVDRVLLGDSTKDLADSLFISAYTVQDHLKSIFNKTGVNSRRELIRLMLTQYSFPYTELENQRKTLDF